MLRRVVLVKNRRFGGTYRLHHQGDKNLRSTNKVSCNLYPMNSAKKYLALNIDILLLPLHVYKTRMLMISSGPRPCVHS
jgi:hypothetical protein